MGERDRGMTSEEGGGGRGGETERGFYCFFSRSHRLNLLEAMHGCQEMGGLVLRCLHPHAPLLSRCEHAGLLTRTQIHLRLHTQRDTAVGFIVIFDFQGTVRGPVISGPTCEKKGALLELGTPSSCTSPFAVTR